MHLEANGAEGVVVEDVTAVEHEGRLELVGEEEEEEEEGEEERKKATFVLAIAHATEHRAQSTEHTNTQYA